MNRPGWRSVRAVLLGFVAVFLLSLGSDQLLHALSVYPPWGEPMRDGLFVLASSYRLIYGVLGSYITAVLAPANPMKHSLAGGLIGTLVAAAGAMATWNGGPSFGPHWYSILLVLTALPCAWAGGIIAQNVSRE